MNNEDPRFVDFNIARPEQNIVTLVLPDQIIILNLVTRQAIIVPAGVFYEAALDELQLERL